jgi:hypothetical protein
MKIQIAMIQKKKTIMETKTSPKLQSTCSLLFDASARVLVFA